MSKSNSARTLTILAFAFIGGALCGAIMGIGRTVTSYSAGVYVGKTGKPTPAAAPGSTNSQHIIGENV